MEVAGPALHRDCTRWDEWEAAASLQSEKLRKHLNSGTSYMYILEGVVIVGRVPQTVHMGGRCVCVCVCVCACIPRAKSHQLSKEPTSIGSTEFNGITVATAAGSQIFSETHYSP